LPKVRTTSDDEYRVLCVNCVHPNVDYETRYPSLAFCYLCSMARKIFPDTRFVFRIVNSEVERELDTFRPHLFLLSSVSQNFNYAKEYATIAVSKGVTTLVGGMHVTALPASLPKGAIAVIGEGEATFMDVLRAFLNDELSKELQNIPGLGYWDGDTFKQSAPRNIIADLDTVPFPARDLIKIKPYMAHMFSSRGCPYNCVFCYSTRFWNKVRFFSAEYVVDEIEILVREYQVNYISFADDMFVANRKRIEEIIRILEQRNLLGRVRYTTSCRANVVNEELAMLLNRMNVVCILMGLESGNDEILSYLKGGNVLVADAYKAIAILRKHGIVVNASFIIGSPDETRQHMMDTFNFIKKNGLSLFDLSILTPYPGTPVWEHAKKVGAVSDDMPDWSVLDVNVFGKTENVINLCEHLSTEELLEIYKKFDRLRIWFNSTRIWTHPYRHRIIMLILDSFKSSIIKRLSCSN